VLSFAWILTVPTPTLKVALVFLSILLAWATWKYVELTMRKRGSRIGPSADIIALSMELAFSCLLGGILFRANGVTGRLTSNSTALLMDFGGSSARPDYIDGPVHLKSLGFRSQSKAGIVDAVVVGDSHAKCLFPGLAAVDQGRTWLLIGNHSCPPTLGITIEPDTNQCAEKMEQAFDYLTGPDGPSIVVLAFYGYYAETTDFSADHMVNGKGPSHIILRGERQEQSKEDVFSSGLGNAIQSLLAHGKRVYLVVDVPELSFFPRDCVERPFFAMTKRADCYERADIDKRQLGLRRIVRGLQERFPALGVFDPLPLICGGLRCSPVSADFSYYQDSHHLSRRGSKKVAGALVAMINRTEPIRDASPPEGLKAGE
jgi:SGNH domain (fused to AT3 domains)